MTITLKYNANVMSDGGTYIDGLLDTTQKEPEEIVEIDTIIFTKGDFSFKNRKDYNYWKEESKRPQIKKYRMKKYYYDGKSGRQECYNDTLRLYQNVNTKKGEMKCILVDSKGVIVARGKKKYDPNGGGVHRSAWLAYGRWYFYDNNGRLISSGIRYGMKLY